MAITFSFSYYVNLRYVTFFDNARIYDSNIHLILLFLQSFQFMSDIGGTLGLCIGGSILSLFEFVQLLIEIIHFFRVKFTHQKSSKISDSMQDLNIDMKIVEKVQIQNTPSEGAIFHPNYVISDNYKGSLD